jgi:hypothetical protein
MFTKSRSFVIGLLIIVALTTVQAASTFPEDSLTEFLVWESTAGTTVTARLVVYDVEAKTLTLERENGTKIVVPLSKISEKSRAIAEKAIQKTTQTEKDKIRRTSIGRWYWKCPSKSQPLWWIESELFQEGSRYELIERSTGHRTDADSEIRHEYRKQGDLFISPTKPKSEGQTGPFKIDSNGDRVVYTAKIVMKGKVIDAGGKFIDIHYHQRADAEQQRRIGESFPSITLK